MARAAGQIADAWTWLILREVFLGNRRFESMRLHIGMSPRSLSLRLGQLVAHDILEKAPVADAAAAHEYRLTPKGLDLWPVLVTLRQWGERWAGPWGREGAPLPLMHRGHGHPLKAVLHCADCGEPVDARAAEVQITPAVRHERAAFAAEMAAASPRRPP